MSFTAIYRDADEAERALGARYVRNGDGALISAKGYVLDGVEDAKRLDTPEISEEVEG